MRARTMNSLRIFIALLILVTYILAAPGIQHYKTLGIQKNASQADIKKAFKKMSLKYHPDKNKNDPKKAEAMFQKIVEAYDVLKDPEQRKIYDQHGEEGIKQNNQQQQGGGGGGFPGGFRFNQGGGGGGGFEDVFSQFFNRGGGGGGFHHQHQQQQQRIDLFSQSDVYELEMGSLSKFLRRQEVWVILFYKPGSQESQKLKDSYRELASKYYGIFRVAAVDCDEEDALCEDEFSVHNTPTIQVYESNIRSEGHPYKGAMTDIQKIASFAVSFMESYVRSIRSSNYEEFIQENPEKNKILLFTQKKSTPPLFRALSKEYNAKLTFGEVRDTDKELISAFQITSYPTLLVLTDPASKAGVKYEGTYKKDQIQKFLREYSYVRSTANIPAPVKQLTPEIVKSPSTCGVQDVKLCLIIVTANDSISSEEAVNVMKGLASKYASETKLKFFHVPRRLIEVENIFDNEDFAILPAVLVIKGKRGRFARYNPDAAVTQENLEMYLEDVLTGGGNFKPMHDTLNGNVFADRADL